MRSHDSHLVFFMTIYINLLQLLPRLRASSAPGQGTGGRSMTLLAEVIESHGGADLWRRLRRFSAHLSIDGVLLADKGKADTLKDVVVDGSTREQFLRFTGFTAPDLRATYRPDPVPVQTLDRPVLPSRHHPPAA